MTSSIFPFSEVIADKVVIFDTSFMIGSVVPTQLDEEGLNCLGDGLLTRSCEHIEALEAIAKQCPIVVVDEVLTEYTNHRRALYGALRKWSYHASEQELLDRAENAGTWNSEPLLPNEELLFESRAEQIAASHEFGLMKRGADYLRRTLDVARLFAKRTLQPQGLLTHFQESVRRPLGRFVRAVGDNIKEFVEKNGTHYNPKTKKLGTDLQTDAKVVSTALAVAYEKPAVILTRDIDLYFLALAAREEMRDNSRPLGYGVPFAPRKEITLVGGKWSDKSGRVITEPLSIRMLGPLPVRHPHYTFTPYQRSSASTANL